MRQSCLAQARPALSGRAWARAAALALLALLAGCSAASRPARQLTAAQKLTDHYGGYASYLPKDTLNPASAGVLTGTSQRPALVSQGETVRVKTARWSVLVTIAGPQVPNSGLPYQRPTTTCTWTVTMSGASGPVPISVASFTSIDHLGQVYYPRLVPGQPRPPRVLTPGQQVTFELRAVELAGEGLMRWSPYHHLIDARWDFIVETN